MRCSRRSTANGSTASHRCGFLEPPQDPPHSFSPTASLPIPRMVQSLQPLARIPPFAQYPALLPQILATLPQLHPQKTLAGLQIRHRLLGLRSPTQNLSPETIDLRLSALSSFYTYITQTYTHLSPEGVEQPYTTTIPSKQSLAQRSILTAKPAASPSTRRAPSSIPFRAGPQGKRDYALFLAYLATGRRNSEIRSLRWGDFQRQNQD